jgi:hypothetical protein
LKRLLDVFWCSELDDAHLLGHDGALVLWLELGHQLRHIVAGLLGIEIAGLFGNVDKTRDLFVMAFLCSLLKCAPSAADLNRQLITLGVADKLTRTFFYILCSACRLVDSLAYLLSFAIANLFGRLIALLHHLLKGLFLKGDLTVLLKVLLAHLLLGRSELGDIGEVALLNILVGAL